jgi:hypothetical protein
MLQILKNISGSVHTYICTKNKYCPFIVVLLLNIQKWGENKVRMQHTHFEFEECCMYDGAYGSVVAKALCYKLKGHGFETQ